MIKKRNKASNEGLVKTLLLIVAIKLFLVFVVLKVFFLPNYLNKRFDTDAQKSAYIGSRLTNEHRPSNSTP